MTPTALAVQRHFSFWPIAYPDDKRGQEQGKAAPFKLVRGAIEPMFFTEVFSAMLPQALPQGHSSLWQLSGHGRGTLTKGRLHQALCSALLCSVICPNSEHPHTGPSWIRFKAGRAQLGWSPYVNLQPSNGPALQTGRVRDLREH